MRPREDAEDEGAKVMRYVSLFSGIEAASVAWEPLGWEPVAFAEIEPFPCKVFGEAVPRCAEPRGRVEDRLEPIRWSS